MPEAVDLEPAQAVKPESISANIFFSGSDWTEKMASQKLVQALGQAARINLHW